MSEYLSKRLESLEAYIPGEQPKDMKYLKLNTNESPYPPSPKVFERLCPEEIGKLNLYPDPEGIVLRKKIADLYSVKPEHVFLSNGSDEILSFAFMAFCDDKNKIAFPNISYGFYKVYAELYGVDYTEIPLNEDFTLNCQDYFNLNKNIVIANPNAPTGLSISVDEVESILKTNPNHVVIIDEAYVDFGGESCYKLINSYNNLLVVQTYSKSRAMAGARLGFAFASKRIIDDLNKIKYSTNPYNINRLTMIAGEAAIDDNDYYKNNCNNLIITREYTSQSLKDLGFEVTDSKANFLFAKSQKISGNQLYLQLKAAGILVRHFDKEIISDYIRITIGTKNQMNEFLDAIKKIIEK